MAHPNALPPKQMSLLAFAVVVLSVAIGALLALVPPFSWSQFLWVLPGLALVAGFLIALRIRCPGCGAILSRSFPYKGGGAILLWVARERCPKWRQELGWN